VAGNKYSMLLTLVRFVTAKVAFFLMAFDFFIDFFVKDNSGSCGYILN